MSFNLKEKCDGASSKVFYYGHMANHDIKDVYLGLGYLEPNESNRKEGPGKAHEDILYAIDRQIQVTTKEGDIILNPGEVLFIPEGENVYLKNLTGEKCYFMVAGGHPKPHGIKI